jgi:hypothetical protein
MSTSSESESDDSSSNSESDSADTSELLVASIVTLIAMVPSEKYLGKRRRHPPRQFEYQWAMDQLQINRDCYNMFRMNLPVFDRLHETSHRLFHCKECTKIIHHQMMSICVHFMILLRTP